ncbi:MAG TPA: polyprenol monophosphomannose synthase [Candidatus Dormibacteraeota bacterium]|nr:polyprenol monophosphomannose synthase [Candidatus Dormibacteraeota bacterium]
MASGDMTAGTATPDVSVVIPTYNERENIEHLLPQICAVLADRRFEVLVVDDRSPDGTADAVRAFAADHHPVRLIAKARKEGIGAALRVGYGESQGAVILSTDADLSFDPADLPRLLARLEQGADLVVGTRHGRGGGYESPTMETRIKWCLSAGGNWVLRTATGIPLTDFSGNFRAIRRDVWREIETVENTNTLLFEMILKAYVRGYVVAEVPVVFRDRRFGVSKLQMSREAPRFLRRFWRFIWQHRRELRRRRRDAAA